MRLFLAPIASQVPQIDLLTQHAQVFQGEIPNFSSFFSPSSRKSDAYLIPHDACVWDEDYSRLVERLAHDKLVLYFNRSDNPVDLNIANTISLQTTCPPRAWRSKFIIVPYNVQKLGIAYSKNRYPKTISFVGFVPRLYSRSSWANAFRGKRHPIKENGALVRHAGIRMIRRSRLPSLIRTRKVYGGAKSLSLDVQKTRSEFMESIANSDFVFCPRGDANGSQRFYEVLSAGRIPLVPDTKIKLPKIQNGNSNYHFLSCKTLSTDMDDVMLNFVKELGKDSYAEIQQMNRLTFDKYFSYSAYLKFLFLESSTEDLNFLLGET